MVRPRLRISQIDHFVCERPPLVSPHYVTVYDPKEPVFRVTLYSNFAPSKVAGHLVTTEVIRDDQEVEAAAIRQSLDRMGIVDLDNPSMAHERVAVPGFPSMTVAFAEAVAAQREAARQYENVSLGGKASGQAWFMGEVMIEAREIAQR